LRKKEKKKIRKRRCGSKRVGEVSTRNMRSRRLHLCSYDINPHQRSIEREGSSPGVARVSPLIQLVINLPDPNQPIFVA
jgi:hypothetical protein